MRARHARLVVAALLMSSGTAFADEVVLDLDAALARARDAAPAAVIARGRVGEAEARRVGAGVRLTTNPEIEVEAGPRFASDSSVDVHVSVGQSFELGGRKGARRAVADAGVVHAQAEGDADLRDLVLAVAEAFYDCLHADAVLIATRDAAELAEHAADAAARRRKAGDVTDLDVDLAKAALGRSRSAVSAAESERAAAIGRLAALLALDPSDTVVVKGELHPPALPDGDLELAGRADLRALATEGDVADAELRLARASARPDLGLWVSYGREEDANIVLGGIRLTWPVWNRNQGDKAEARARKRRVEAEYAVTERTATRATTDARAAYDGAQKAVDTYETEVIPLLDESESLLTRTIDAGQLAVSDYLVARQELLDGRREYLDRVLALAHADVRVRFEMGALQ